MSFTIDKNAHFSQLKRSVAWNWGNKDDGTISSNKSYKSALDVTEVSLALTMATFESKMTTSFDQMREDAKEDRKAAKRIGNAKKEWTNVERPNKM